MVSRRLPLLAFCLASLTGLAHAGQAYVGAGAPGLIVGWGTAINQSFAVRADYAYLGTLNQSGHYNDIPYQGQLEFQRAALLADYFFAGKWRVTTGVAFNKADLRLHFQGDNSFVKINGVSVFAGQADQLDTRFKFPKYAPYLGLGYGLKLGESGWGFSADVGALIGQPQMSYGASPSLIAKAGQSNVDQEMNSWNEQARKLRAIPQLTVGASYNF